jgi:hypothetical protein
MRNLCGELLAKNIGNFRWILDYGIEKEVTRAKTEKGGQEQKILSTKSEIRNNFK